MRPEAEYWTAAQVRARFGGASCVWIARKLAAADFPKPVFLGGRLRYWRVRDVLAWERRMIERGASLPPPRRKRPTKRAA